MNWFADKLGPAPRGSRAATNTTSRSAPQQPQKGAAQKSAPASQQRAAPAPAPEPDKKKKKGWF
jgi:hypothetical protein